MTTTTAVDKKVVGVSVLTLSRYGKPMFWTMKGLVKLIDDNGECDLEVCEWECLYGLPGTVRSMEAKLAERLARKVMAEGRKPNFKRTRPGEEYLYAYVCDREDLAGVKEELKKPFQVVELGYFLDPKTIEEAAEAVDQEDAQDDPNVAYFVTRPKRFGLKVYKGENWNGDGSIETSMLKAWGVYKRDNLAG